VRVLVSIRTSVPGLELGDTYKHVWPYWHTLAQLSEGTWPYTRFLNAPVGGSLLDVMLVPAVLMAPVTAIAGPVAAANLWVWISLFFVGVASFLLCRSVTGSVVGAVCAGLMVQTSPFMLGYVLTSGVHERLAVWVFPMVMLGMLQAAHKGGLRWPLLLVPIVGISTLGSPKLGLQLAGMMCLAIPIVVWPSRKRSLRARLLNLMPILVLTGAVLVSVFLGVRWVTNLPPYLAEVGNTSFELYTTSHLANQYDPSTFRKLLDPFAVSRTVPGNYEDQLYRLVYLGWVPLLAMVVGVVVACRRRRWRTVAIVTLGMFFVAASLGPVIWGAHSGLLNPCYLLFSTTIPLFHEIHAVWQLVGVFWGLVGISLAQFIGAFRSTKAQLVVGAVLVLATVGERAIVLPVPVIVEPSPGLVDSVYDGIHGDGVVMDWPRTIETNTLTPDTAFLAQTQHHQPIVDSINYRASSWYPFRLDTSTSQSLGPGIHCLKKRGVRWVVVHADWFPDPEQGEAAVQQFIRVVGSAEVSTEDAWLFDLDPFDETRFEPASDCRGLLQVNTRDEDGDEAKMKVPDKGAEGLGFGFSSGCSSVSHIRRVARPVGFFQPGHQALVF